MPRRLYDSPSIRPVPTSPGSWPSFLGNAAVLSFLAALLVAHSRPDESSAISGPARPSAVLRSRSGKMMCSLSFSADGRHLAIGGLDSDVEIRDVESGRLVKTLDTNRGAGRVGPPSLNSFLVAFSPDGRFLAVGDSEGVVEVVYVAGWEKVSRHSEDQPIRMMAWSPDGQTLAIESTDREVCLWEVTTDRVSRLAGSNRRVDTLAYSPDGGKIATGDADGFVRLWDLATGSELWSHRSHSGGIGRVNFSKDGTTLMACGASGPIKAWDAATGREKAAPVDESRGYSMLANSPDGTMIATAYRDETITLWDLTDGRKLAHLGGYSGSITALEWSSDGRIIAATAYDSGVRLWKVDSNGTVQGHRRPSHRRAPA